MRSAVLIALLCLDATATPCSAQSTATSAVLADSDVAQAVEFGKANKNKKSGYSGSANCNGFLQDFLPVYAVVAQGPLGRISSASADATRKYATFGPADVTAEMRAPSLAIGIQQDLKQWPDGSLKSDVVAVDHVVIRGFDDKGEPGPAVQPTHVEPLPATWQNLMGGKVETKGVLATFDTQALPEGDLQ